MKRIIKMEHMFVLRECNICRGYYYASHGLRSPPLLQFDIFFIFRLMKRLQTDWLAYATNRTAPEKYSEPVQGKPGLKYVIKKL